MASILNFPPLMYPSDAFDQQLNLDDGYLNNLNCSAFLSGEDMAVPTNVFDYRINVNTGYYEGGPSYPLAFFTEEEPIKAEVEAGPWDSFNNLTLNVFQNSDYYSNSTRSNSESSDYGSDTDSPPPSPPRSPSPSPPPFLSPQVSSIVLISSRSPSPFTFTPPETTPALTFSSLPPTPPLPITPSIDETLPVPSQLVSPPGIRRSLRIRKLPENQKPAATQTPIFSRTSITSTRKRKHNTDSDTTKDSDKEDSDDSDYSQSPKRTKCTPKKVQPIKAKTVQPTKEKKEMTEEEEHTLIRMENWKKILEDVLIPRIKTRRVRDTKKHQIVTKFICPCSWKKECKREEWDTLHQVLRHWGSVHLAEGFEILDKNDDRRIRLLGLQACIKCERILSRPDAMLRHKNKGSCIKPRRTYGYYAHDYLYWKYGGFKNWVGMHNEMRTRDPKAECLC